MFWSAELGVAKSSEAAFAAVESRLDVEPGAILFIDDSAGNVARATSRGWDAICYRGLAPLERELADRGLPP
jgi:HAD superfamily hydrolase (TIGR01509 family)